MKEITSLTHPIVQHLVELRKNSHYRREMGTVLLEGRNAIFDVCKKHRAKRLLLVANEKVPEDLLADEILIITEQIIKKISSLEKPDTIIAEVYAPKMEKLPSGSRFLALDHLQDPGNMGTLIRTALALGWDGVFLITPCCDPLNDKALRAAKGATFDLPLCMGTWDQLSAFIQKEKLKTFAADFKGSAPEAIQNDEKILLILGNEAQGVKLPSNFEAKTITIAMNASIESLNVATAGAILMYTMRRQ